MFFIIYLLIFGAVGVQLDSVVSAMVVGSVPTRGNYFFSFSCSRVEKYGVKCIIKHVMYVFNNISVKILGRKLGQG